MGRLPFCPRSFVILINLPLAWGVFHMARKTVLVAFADVFSSEWVKQLERFPADAVMLTGPTSIANAAHAAVRRLSSPKRPAAYLALADTGFETVLDALETIRKQMPAATLVVNVDAAGKRLTAAALAAAMSSASFVTLTDGEEPTVLEPVKFSYCATLSPTKARLLCELSEKPASSLRELAARSGLPVPLASYHLHGDARSQGLESLRLLSVQREDGRLKIAIAPMGRIYLRGCMTCPKPMVAKQKVAEKVRVRAPPRVP